MIIYPQTFDDVLADISLIGEATGYTEEAEAVVTDIQDHSLTKSSTKQAEKTYLQTLKPHT